jgi:hypothetical protein
MSSVVGAKVEEWQRQAGPVEWTGDLDDDCTASWAGLILRAEEMKRGVWWWAVYDDQLGELIVSSDDTERFSNGNKARAAAEKAAREWLKRGLDK